MEISCVGLDRQEMIKKIMEREQRDKIQKEEKGCQKKRGNHEKFYI